MSSSLSLICSLFYILFTSDALSEFGEDILKIFIITV